MSALARLADSKSDICLRRSSAKADIRAECRAPPRGPLWLGFNSTTRYMNSHTREMNQYAPDQYFALVPTTDV
jgi:hypothetical protein